MLIIPSKYKIAKRLGGGIFEQTQTQKYALSEARSKKRSRGGRGGSDYGRQLLEKQRIRYTYGLSERQLSNYAKKAILAEVPAEAIHRALEMRLDSAVYRLGMASTRRAARQMVSHGHITVNGKRTTIPSHALSVGDIISVREGSRRTPLFVHLVDAEKARSIPSWLSFDVDVLKAEVKVLPEYKSEAGGMDYPTLFEFYSR